MVSTSWSPMFTTYAPLGCVGDRLSTCFSALVRGRQRREKKGCDGEFSKIDIGWCRKIGEAQKDGGQRTLYRCCCTGFLLREQSKLSPKHTGLDGRGVHRIRDIVRCVKGRP